MRTDRLAAALGPRSTGGDERPVLCFEHWVSLPFSSSMTPAPPRPWGRPGVRVLAARDLVGGGSGLTAWQGLFLYSTSSDTLEWVCVRVCVCARVCARFTLLLFICRLYKVLCIFLSSGAS